MKFLKQLLIIVIFIGFSVASFAQVSGYQGKRFIFGYDNTFGFALSNPNSNGSKWMNFRHDFAGEYVLNRHTSLAFRTSYYRTGVSTENFEQFYVQYQYTGSGYTDYNGYYMNVINTDLIVLNCIDIGAAMRWYNEDLIAPLGVYHQFGASAIIYSIANSNLSSPTISDAEEEIMKQNDDYNDVTILNPEDFPSSTHLDNSPYSALKISYTIGKHRVFFNRVVFNAALETGWVLGGFKHTTTGSEMGFDTFSVSNDILKNKAKGRLFAHHFFNMKLGLGFLIF